MAVTVALGNLFLLACALCIWAARTGHPALPPVLPARHTRAAREQIKTRQRRLARPWRR